MGFGARGADRREKRASGLSDAHDVMEIIRPGSCTAALTTELMLRNVRDR